MTKASLPPSRLRKTPIANALSHVLVRVGLRFRNCLAEEEFTQSFVRARVRQTQAAMLLGSFVFYVFFLWDKVIDPERWETTHLVRSMIVLFVLWPATALLQLPAVQRRIETVLLVYATVPSVGLALIYAILDRGFDYGAAGVVIVILFVFTLLPHPLFRPVLLGVLGRVRNLRGSRRQRPAWDDARQSSLHRHERAARNVLGGNA
jgi:hypothetical protein